MKEPAFIQYALGKKNPKQQTTLKSSSKQL